MTRTATALIGFAGWFVLLSAVMAVYRTLLVQRGTKQANEFAPDGSDLPGFGRRLTRARDNCFESLPAFAALALGASLLGRLEVLEPLAPWVLYARIAQSSVHVLSTSVPAVLVRATLFFAQLGIYGWWAVKLLA
jgi:uncharacterized MAPEG superfamily protein